MKVSVIVPVFQTEKQLPIALNSILFQSLDQIETVVVNDGSNGDCDSIVRQYSQRMPINYVQLPKNMGRMIARIEGMKAAHGDYVGFVDADDYIHKDMYQIMYAEAINDDADIVHCRTINVNNKKKSLWERGISEYTSLRDDAIYEEFLNRKLLWSIWDKIFRRSIVEKSIPELPLVRQQLNEDMIICSVLFFHAKSYISCKDALYYYVSSKSSVVNNISYLQAPDLLQTLAFIRNFTCEHTKFDFRASPLYDLLVSDILSLLHHINPEQRDTFLHDLAQSLDKEDIFDLINGFEKNQTKSNDQIIKRIYRSVKYFL